ncbi:hypothetical protein D3C81_2098880 [compost metagenome]
MYTVKYPGFLMLLGLLFIALKLTKVISWSWFWVLTPIWGLPVLIIGFAAFTTLFAVVMPILGAAFGKKR